MTALIEFRAVRKSFGDLEVYRDLSLGIREGEILTVIGGSGVGKSVLLRLLIGLAPVDGGEIFFDSKRIDNLSERQFAHLRRRIGMLFQGAALFDSLSVGENIAYPLREHGRPTEAEVRRRVAQCLEDVGLPGIEARAPSELSTGMRKRIGLARAMALNPEVLLYDEPTTGLDPIAREHITELIVEQNERRGLTSVVVTHDMPTAFRLSDRVAMVAEGGIIFEGDLHSLQSSSDPRVVGFVEGRVPD